MSSDIEKTIISGIIAFSAGVALAAIAGLVTFSLPVFFISLVAGVGYTMTTGFNRNGEFERSVGTVFGQVTDWVIPTGFSWWIPRPFGGSTKKVSVAVQDLDRTKKSGNALQEVSTRNNTQVEVSFFVQYVITDPVKAVRIENLTAAFQALMDRGVRWFVREWDADGEFDVAQKKKEFSEYLIGLMMDSTGKPLKDASGQLLPYSIKGPTKDPNGNPIPPETITSDIRAAAAAMGIEILVARIDDINPPKTIVQAREAEAIEAAEAAKEKRDIQSLGDRAQELKNLLGIDGSEALRAAQAARKDITVIRVEGDAGDFAKGQIGSEAYKRAKDKS